MTKQILKFISIAPYDANYDPLLGRNVIEAIDNILDEKPIVTSGSVFDDPELDFAYVAPNETAKSNADGEKTEEENISFEIESTEFVQEEEALIDKNDEIPTETTQDEIIEIDSQEIDTDKEASALEIAEVESAQAFEEELKAETGESETTTTNEISGVENIDLGDAPSEIETSEISNDEISQDNQYSTNDESNITQSSEFSRPEDKESSDQKALDNLFDSAPVSEEKTNSNGLFGAILAGGVKRFRDLGPILGKKNKVVLDVGPILAKKANSDDELAEINSNSDIGNDLFQKPLFGKKHTTSPEAEKVFADPIFGEKQTNEREIIDLWAKTDFQAKEANEFETNQVQPTIIEPINEVQSSESQAAVEKLERELISDNNEFEPDYAQESNDASQQSTEVPENNRETEDLVSPNTSDSETSADEKENSIEEKEVTEPLELLPANEELKEEKSTEAESQIQEDLGQTAQSENNSPVDDDKSIADTFAQDDIKLDNASSENIDENVQTRGDILRAKYREQKEQAKRASKLEKARAQAQRNNRKKKKLNPISFFAATFLTGVFAILTLSAMLAPLGAPFDAISFGRWYIATIGLISALLWLSMRYWVMGVISSLLLIFNLMAFVPSIGSAPRGGKAQRTIGWVDLNNSARAFEKTIKEAERNNTDILFLARANLTRIPANWVLLQAPIRNDPNSITILSKGNWAAATLVGEPTMARLVDNSLTIVAVNPTDPSRSKEKQADRESMINRAAARTGTQETPVISIGSFDEPAWSRQMTVFAQNGQVRRVRCGGFLGSTVNNGLFNLAPDHAFTRGLTVSKCNIGSVMPDGAHRPIWLSVRAEAAPAK